MLDPGWAGLIGALGGSLLGGLTTWGVGEWRDWRQSRDEQQRARGEAYTALLASSFGFVMRAQAFGQAMRLRSGLQEGIAVTFRQRRGLDLFDLYDWLEKDLAALREASSHIWAIGTQEAVDAADELTLACNSLFEAATAIDSQRPQLQTTIFGLGWSGQQQTALQDALSRTAELRVAFAKITRKETGNRQIEFSFERTQRATEASVKGGEAKDDATRTSQPTGAVPSVDAPRAR